MTIPTTDSGDSKSLPQTEKPKPRRWLLELGVVVAFIAGVGGLIYLWVRPKPLPEGVSRSEYLRAEELFQKVYKRRPNRIETLISLGELSVQSKNWDTALACFEEIPADDPEYGVYAILEKGQVLYNLNQADRAEATLRQYLKLAEGDSGQPRHFLTAAYNHLIYLLSVELRLEERAGLLTALHDLGTADVFDSKMLHFPHLLIWRSPKGYHRLQEFLEQDPDNLKLQIALGRYLVGEGQLHDGRTHLENLAQSHPADLNVTAALLECLFEAGDEETFAETAKGLPVSTAGDSGLLLRMRAEFARQEGRFDEAVGFYESVLANDPTNPECHMALADIYGKLGQEKDRDHFLKHSLILSKIRVHLSNVVENDPKAALELAELCEKLGLAQAARTYRQHSERISLKQKRSKALSSFAH